MLTNWFRSDFENENEWRSSVASLREAHPPTAAHSTTPPFRLRLKRGHPHRQPVAALKPRDNVACVCLSDRRLRALRCAKLGRTGKDSFQGRIPARR